MKRPLLYTNPKYFKLLKKYRNLYARLKAMFRDGSYYNLEERTRKSLFNKFKRLFQRLGKMQLSLGIKTAGIAMAFMLVSNIAHAQMPKTWAKNTAGSDLFNARLDVGETVFAKFVDIDGDGDEDMFVCSRYASGYKYRYYENKGANAEEQFVSTDDPANPLLTIDGELMDPPFIDFIDNDGDGDLDIYQMDMGSVLLHKNVGTATQPQFELTTGSENKFSTLDGPFSLAFEDIDQDGDVDAVFMKSNYGGTPRYFENNQGEFTERVSADNPFFGGYAPGFETAIDFHDMDGDGDIDGFGGECGDLRFIENIPVDGNPSFKVNFSDTVLHVMLDWSYGLYPSFVDLDENNDMDLIVNDFKESYIFEYYQNDANSYTHQGPPSMIPTPFQLGYFQRPAFVDIDGDGDLDVYLDDLSEYSNDKLYQNIGTAESPKLKSVPLSQFDLQHGLYNANESFVDIDNDGDLDLFVIDTCMYSAGSNFFKNVGTADKPDFQLQDQSNNPLHAHIEGSYRLTLEFADIDMDGDYDAFFGGSPSYGSSKVFENTGSAEEAAFTPVAFSADPFANDAIYAVNAQFADFDFDGDLDLVINSLVDTCLFAFENVSTVDGINFTELSGENNPFNSIRPFNIYFAMGQLHNEKEISILIGEEVLPEGNRVLNYYSYKDLLALADKIIEVDENTAAETVVAALDAEYYGAGTVSYTLNPGAATVPFEVSAGNLVVAAGADIDYEAMDTPAYTFNVEVSDGIYQTAGAYTIQINNLNDNAPVLEDQTLAIDENPTASDLVAKLNATDADNLGALTYSILDGNTSEAFEFASDSLVVKTASAVDYEALAEHKFVLYVQVSDGELTNNATITVNVNDVDETSSIEDLLKEQLAFYPNPVSNELNVFIGAELQGDIRIDVINSIGDIVKTASYQNRETIQLDVSGLNSGVYFIRVHAGERAITQKIIVQ